MLISKKAMPKSVLRKPKCYEAILGFSRCCLTGDETVAIL